MCSGCSRWIACFLVVIPLAIISIQSIQEFQKAWAILSPSTSSDCPATETEHYNEQCSQFFSNDCSEFRKHNLVIFPTLKSLNETVELDWWKQLRSNVSKGVTIVEMLNKTTGRCKSFDDEYNPKATDFPLTLLLNKKREEEKPEQRRGSVAMATEGEKHVCLERCLKKAPFIDEIMRDMDAKFEPEKVCGFAFESSPYFMVLKSSPKYMSMSNSEIKAKVKERLAPEVRRIGTLMMTAAFDICTPRAIKAFADGTCNFWTALVQALPHFILATGMLLFVAHAITPVRVLLREHLPCVTLRASLNWFGIVAQLLVFSNVFMKHSLSPKLLDASDGWACTLKPGSRHSVEQAVGTVASGSVLASHSKASHIGDVYDCVKFKEFTIGALLEAAVLLGGTVEIFGQLVDLLDSWIFFLRREHNYTKSRCPNCNTFLLRSSRCRYMLVVVLVYSEMVTRAVQEAVDQFPENYRYCHPWTMLVISLFTFLGPPSDNVVQLFKWLTKCDPYDLLQLQILLRIPVYMALTSLLQTWGENEGIRYIGLEKFSEEQWTGEANARKKPTTGTEDAVELAEYKQLPQA